MNSSRGHDTSLTAVRRCSMCSQPTAHMPSMASRYRTSMVLDRAPSVHARFAWHTSVLPELPYHICHNLQVLFTSSTGNQHSQDAPRTCVQKHPTVAAHCSRPGAGGAWMMVVLVLSRIGACEQGEMSNTSTTSEWHMLIARAHAGLDPPSHQWWSVLVKCCKHALSTRAPPPRYCPCCL
jgi:hypothetical protein